MYSSLIITNPSYEYAIDCRGPEYAPDGFKVSDFQLPKRISGIVRLSKIRMFYSNDQRKDYRKIEGWKLLEELRSHKVFTSHVLDFWLQNTNLIPEECIGVETFFWGTIYYCQEMDNFYVRSLCQENGIWMSCCKYINKGVFFWDCPSIEPFDESLN